VIQTTFVMPSMKRTALILASVYFLLGNCLLPRGDFSALSQLGAMYQHCRQAEDPDLDLSDFITEHLLNLDCLFTEKPLTDEHELPHSPPPYHTTIVSVFYQATEPVTISFDMENPRSNDDGVYQSPYFPQFGFNPIFQPPRS
jgi:hypothetical protein